MHFGIVKILREIGKNEEEIDEDLKMRGAYIGVQERLVFNQEQRRLYNVGLYSLEIIKGINQLSPTEYMEEKRLLFSKYSETHKMYSSSFKKEIYNYIVNLFEVDINAEFHVLSKMLNKRVEIHTEELKIEEQVRIAFIESFREFIEDDYIDLGEVSNVGQLPEQMSYFSQLKMKQSEIINKIEEFPILIEAYLEGDEGLIKVELLRDCKIIEDIIDFYSSYKFLLALNKKYNIEDDSKDIIDEKYFQILTEFSKSFSSVEVVVFTFNKIVCFEKDQPAHISSLYYALFERRLVSKNKTEFQRYVFKIHNIKFAKIRGNISKELTPHKKRFNQFLKEIDVHFPSKIV